MTDFFISYARKDGMDFAQQIHDELEGDGHDAWFDKRDIKSSEYWDDAIEKGLKNCKALILLVTPGSNASQNCKDEWSYVLSANKPVILLYFLEVDSFPPRIHRLQYIDFRTNF